MYNLAYIFKASNPLVANVHHTCMPITYTMDPVHKFCTTPDANPPKCVDKNISQFRQHTNMLLVWQVWNLLMVLPTNKSVLEEIAEFREPWAQRFSPSQSLYNLWYSLQVVEGLMEQVPSVDDGSDVRMGSTSWRDRFVELGGLRNLMSILMADKVTSADTLHTHACVSLILKIICAILEEKCKDSGDRGGSANDEKHKNNLANSALGSLCGSDEELSCFMHKVMRIFHTAAMSAGTQQGGSADVVEVNRQSVASYAMLLLDTCSRISTQVFFHIYSFPNIREWVSDTLLRCRSEFIRKVSRVIPHTHTHTHTHTLRCCIILLCFADGIAHG
jgi:hypothetical protein